jgi:riboflavin biosynthesis pyrimidine reductase
VHQIFPGPGPEIAVVPDITPGPVPDPVADLAALYRNGQHEGAADRSFLRANMVASADGAATIAERSGGLAGPADRMVFTVLRSLADVILVGAGTARAERYRPVDGTRIWAGLRPADAAPPPIAVITASLDFSGCTSLLEDARTIVITTGKAAGRAGAVPGRARVVTAGRDRVDVRRALAELRDLGYRQVLCEGGPHLLAELTTAGLLDELCLTTSPLLAPGAADRILAGPTDAAARAVARLSLGHVLADAGFLLTRYECLPD